MARKRKPVTIDAIPAVEISPQENFRVAGERVNQSLGALAVNAAGLGYAALVLIGFALVAFFTFEDD